MSARVLPVLLLLTACSEYEIKGEDDVTPSVDSQPEDSSVDSTPPVDTSPPEDTAPPEDTSPPPVEECNGADDDADGVIDEDFPDTDGDGTADCIDAEDCDGLDNNGDGAVDEGFDTDADGVTDCFESSYTVTLRLTADDAWEGWADEASIGGEGGWSSMETVSLVWDTGPHVLAIHGYDTGLAIAGFIAILDITSYTTIMTGDAGWKVVTTAPDPSWTQYSYDDSGWAAPLPCSASDVSTYWGTTPVELTSLGADWIWGASCTGLGNGYFRLTLTLP